MTCSHPVALRWQISCIRGPKMILLTHLVPWWEWLEVWTWWGLLGLPTQSLLISTVSGWLDIFVEILLRLYLENITFHFWPLTLSHLFPQNMAHCFWIPDSCLGIYLVSMSTKKSSSFPFFFFFDLVKMSTPKQKLSIDHLKDKAEFIGLSWTGKVTRFRQERVIMTIIIIRQY